jgi:serine/threonine-protein kinase
MGALIDHVVAALKDAYAVEREIGSGGAATVFLARDLKHDRPVAIKVLKPAVAAALGADRFLREIDIAAHLNHPHILPLYDSGQAEGLLYYVMPFVEGESLRDRLEREGALPIREAVRIARQVAVALEYAHAAGVVHRDIKPGNILLSSGEAVVADFGIARALDDAAEQRLTQLGMAPGTLWYMSPEQAAGEAVDGRSDVYSLGCVLYEMLAGRPPFAGAHARVMLALQSASPASIASVRDTVPGELEAVVFRALARLPADRFDSAAAFAAALETFTTGTAPVARPAPRRRLPRRFKRAAAIVVPMAVAMVLLIARDSGGIDFDERDWIVIADLENGTGDPVFDRSLNTALTVAIDQSRYVNVYPRARVAETLGRMGRAANELLAPDLAREIAVRENIRAVLAFAIAGIDSTYVLTTRIVEPETGVAVESETVRVVGKADVLAAVDELARRLRSSLGESLRAIRQRSVPLPLATTSSLEALKRFADGSAAWSDSRWAEARSHWVQAVTLDSSFAWANASLGLAADWIDGRGAGAVHFERARRLLDRVTEKERLWILSLIGDGHDALDALRAYTQQWPDDRDAWYNLGNMLRGVNRPEEALDAYERAVALDSLCSWCYGNAGMVYQGLGRFTESEHAFRRAFELDPRGRTQVRGDLNRNYGFVLAALGDTAAARALFDELLSIDGTHRANGLRSLALLDMLVGRMADAIAKLEEAIGLTASLEQPLSEYRNRLYLASLHDLQGQSARATAERARAQRLAESLRPAREWLLILGMQYARSGEVDRAAAILETMEEQTGQRTAEYEQANLMQMRGELALARGEVDAGETMLRTAHGLWDTPGRLESLAFAAYRANRLDEAERLHRDFVAHPRLGEELQAYWIHALHRLGHILEQRGDTAGAIEFYGRFLELWRNGDADLSAVVQVGERLSRLAVEPSSR